MLKEYVSKPSTILACMIEDKGKVTKLKEEHLYLYKHKGKGASTTVLEFYATQEPEVGDYIIQQSKKDIYHCPADVFMKKYSVKGSSIL